MNNLQKQEYRGKPAGGSGQRKRPGRGKNKMFDEKFYLNKAIANPTQVAKIKPEETTKFVEVQKNMWSPINSIPTLEQREPVKKPSTWELSRSNVRVVEGTAGSIQINLDKSKGLTEKAKMNPKSVEHSAVGKSAPEQKLPTPAAGRAVSSLHPQGATQSSGVAPQGRMTASSFMKVKQTPKAKPLMSMPMQFSGAAFNFPKAVTGIPRSFLIQKQLEEQMKFQHESPTSTHGNPQGSNSTAGQGPIWEASKQPPNNWNQVQSSQSFGKSGSQEKIFVHVDNSGEPPKQAYSPSDTYNDTSVNEGIEEDEQEESADGQQSGSKRLSAFQRLGPPSQPKKPKLTINLLINKEQAVREVVDQSDDSDGDKYAPVHLKPEIQTSLDDTVMKYLLYWPWKKKLIGRRTYSARQSKSMMLAELELIDELYGSDTMFFQVSVTGYPASWNKEDVLDAVLESVKGNSFIPCFTEFSKTECKFVVIRSRVALKTIHKYGFVIWKDEVELTLSIIVISLNVNQIDFIPRLILRKRMSLAMEGETEINLKEFTTKSDISHFIYFPLNRVTNQTELMHLQSSVPWKLLTKLVLSHNRLTTLSGFNLVHYTPRLKHLDISYNCFEAVTPLLQCRDLPLQCLVLEGNPLCTDYIQQDRYIKVLRMIFPGLKEIDGVSLGIGQVFPDAKRNYCPPDAAHVVEKLLEVLFPLLDAPPDERHLVEDLYDTNAVVTITYMYKLRYGPIYTDYRSLFSHARVMDEGDMESINGASGIAKVVNRWPMLEHDPLTFTVDVMYHSDTSTILRVAGIVKLTAETLAEDEHLLSFTRTIVLHSLDTVEYKIINEMIYWDLPDKERAKEAFRMTSGRSKRVSLKLEGPPDLELKENLLNIFMKLTEMERKPSEKCLEMKEWHLKNALEYFTTLMKFDDLQRLNE